MNILLQQIATAIVLAGFPTASLCRAGTIHQDVYEVRNHAENGPMIESEAQMGIVMIQHEQRIFTESRIPVINMVDTAQESSDSIFSNLTPEERRRWRFGDPEKSGTARIGVGIQRMPSEMTVLRRPDDRRYTGQEQRVPREYLMGGARQPSDLYEWYDVRLILCTWVGMWTTETDAIPGALVNVRF